MKTSKVTTKAAPKRKGNKHEAGKRWTLVSASREFGSHREQMERARRANHIEPGEDNRFSTKQICAMVFGDKQLADARRAEADAESAIRRNLREDLELLPTQAAGAATDPVLIVLRQQICSSSLSEAEKDDMLEGIESGLKNIDWRAIAKRSLK